MPDAAVVIVIDPTHHVLVLKRSATDRYMPGYWNFPGGTVKVTEFPIEAARRELREEAGIYARPGALNYATSLYNGVGRISAFVYYVEERPPVALLDGEHDEYRWVPFREIPNPATLITHRVVREVTWQR